MSRAGEPLTLGCSKCRFAAKGCSRCRDPSFKGRRGSRLAPPAPQSDPVPPPVVSDWFNGVSAADSSDDPGPDRLHTSPLPPPAEDAPQPVKHSHFFAASDEAEQPSSLSQPETVEKGASAPAASLSAGPDCSHATAVDSYPQQEPSEAGSARTVTNHAPSDGGLSDTSDFKAKLQERMLQNKSSPRKLLTSRQRPAPNARAGQKRIKVHTRSHIAA